MDDSPNFLEPRNLNELQGLELKARRIVEGWVTGMHRSPYHGASVEFAEHREYVPGDDLRYLDWKAYGKSDRFFVKEFEEETNFACQLVLDHSDSMRYQYVESPVSKLEYAKIFVAALANLIVSQQDAVGLTTFGEQVTYHGPMARGQQQLKKNSGSVGTVEFHREDRCRGGSAYRLGENATSRAGDYRKRLF